MKSVIKKLAYDIYEAGGKGGIHPSDTALFLHGIMGSKINWRTPCNNFVKMHPQYRAIAVDLR
jgi:pimeloyl-ACP methyl ester carboxylesterase